MLIAAHIDGDGRPAAWILDEAEAVSRSINRRNIRPKTDHACNRQAKDPITDAGFRKIPVIAPRE